MKTKEKNLAEIVKNEKFRDKAKTIRSLAYYDGWNDALKWVLE